jgi:GWxTD domain-containing protein
VSYRLVDDLERTIQERVEEVPCEGFRTLLDLPLDTGSLSFGDFRVEVSVKVPKEGHELYRELWFSADESLLSMKAGFPRSLEIIETIATDEELQKLEDAAPNERKDAWEAFWASRDPDPATKANEARLDFFRRVRFANQHFGTALQPGWRTDRGRVLLEHGHPDQIDRGPSSPGQPSLEIWRYHALGLEFRFVDETGLGEFRLVSRL